MAELQTPKAIDIVREARSHLECALGQAVPGDDQIIIGHVRSASELLKLVIDATKEAA